MTSGSIEYKKMENEKLWHWSAESARELFKKRVRKAGFPNGMFSYHSLRSGFLCSALLNASCREEKEAILERTALVAGWKFGGRSQLLYIKEAFLS